MTVKELKEKLEQYPERCVVLIPGYGRYIRAEHVGIGFNEMDGCVIIDDYIETDEEDDSCDD